MKVRTALLPAALAAGAIALTACGGNASPSAAPATSSAPASSGAAQPGVGAAGANAPAQAATVSLAVAQNPQLGAIVTGTDGKTLYRFDKDTPNPSVSNCNGKCAMTWPPLLINSPQVQASGLDTSLLGTVKRADGTVQLTLHGWPLYYFHLDTQAGDIKGQGIGGTWFAITPQGKKALGTASTGTGSGSTGGGYGAPAAPAPTSSSGTGGYTY